jgi:hypothetical protein
MIRPMIFSTRNFTLVLALVLLIGALFSAGSFHDEGPFSHSSTSVIQLDTDQPDPFDFHVSDTGFLLHFASGFHFTAAVFLSGLVSLFILPESRAPPRVTL